MCGHGNRCCGLCSHDDLNGGCLCGINEDMFVLASKQTVKERLESGRYDWCKTVLERYLSINDDDIAFLKSVLRES